MNQAVLFIMFRGLEIQMKVEGNSNEFPPKNSAQGSTWEGCG